jgi:hypothetical protein
MMITPVLEAVHTKIFADTDIKAEVGTNIHYARGCVTSIWPQIVYWDVTAQQGYNVDFNSVTVQFSVWGDDKFQVTKITELIALLFGRFSGTVTTGLGDVEINYTSLIDTSALPTEDDNLYGRQLRYLISYRGLNLGGL